MNTAVPLPSVQDVFTEDEVARTAYTRLVPLENQAELFIRVLGQVLIQAPSLEERALVAQRIHDCATNQELIELGKSHLEQFVEYIKGLRALSSPPKLARGEILLNIPTVAPRSHLEAKKQALVRDNYRCVVSGFVDVDGIEALPRLEKDIATTSAMIRCTECCHIFPEQGDWDDSDSEEPGHHNNSSRFTLAHVFGGAHEPSLTETGIYDLRNMLTLETGTCAAFREFMIWLEPTGEVASQYRLVGRYAHYGKDLPEVVTFFSTSPDLLLPHPRFLAFHAACARVLQLSGAGKFINRLLHQPKYSSISTYSKVRLRLA
ncbi:unnamed protein product [Rhizoctonia solani]|uniref:HNH nuclease domain-containing protein n=1 Tax=Rhizoctonia solani TaxID=456999 RepID=A0A8H3A5F3_9AGAM|nr:unnamed protein product [Rhizoctonia solani]